MFTQLLAVELLNVAIRDIGDDKRHILVTSVNSFLSGYQSQSSQGLAPTNLA